MPDDSESSHSPNIENSKVERIIQKYGLEELRDELVRYWLGDGTERKSLRSLADYFNKRLIRRALLESGNDPLQGEVENFYELLTGENTTEGMRLQARDTLEQQGLDVEELKNDFVSHQAIHTYLRDYRGVERTEAGDEKRLKNSLESIHRLVSRLDAVTEKTLNNLRSTGRLDIVEFDVIIQTQIICEQCGRQYQIEDLFDRGGCKCQK